MKGEYGESKDMFSKLHQIQPYHPNPDTAGKSDGATIEVSRRPRGRPPGSKNKPKPPLVITREPEAAMSPYILEIAAGADVADNITRFCKRRGTALSVLTASGAVASVTLRQPAATPGATVTFHGRFEVLSLSATVYPAGAPPGTGGFSISLAGPQGQIVGGLVVGPLVAAATVFVVAASFNNPSFHRLPVEEDVRSSGSGGGGNEVKSPAAAVSGGDGSGGEMAAMYTCHLQTGDVIWAPTARPAPPHYQ